MNCHYCGTALQGSELFCRHCGTRLQRAPQTEPEIPAAAQIEQPVQPEPVPAVEVPALEVKEIPFPWKEPVYKEKTFDWQPYGGAPAKEEPLVTFVDTAPADKPKLQLPVKRSLWKMILFSILTLGIYPMVIWSRLAGEVNLVASRYDGERSMSFFGMLMLTPVTLGIHSLVWMHKLCRRIGAELQRRYIEYTFGSKDFWIWAFLMGILSSICLSVCIALAAAGFDGYIVLWLLLAVGIFSLTGPFIFTAKLLNAVNHMNEDYNTNG